MSRIESLPTSHRIGKSRNSKARPKTHKKETPRNTPSDTYQHTQKLRNSYFGVFFRYFQGIFSISCCRGIWMSGWYFWPILGFGFFFCFSVADQLVLKSRNATKKPGKKNVTLHFCKSISHTTTRATPNSSAAISADRSLRLVAELECGNAQGAFLEFPVQSRTNYLDPWGRDFYAVPPPSKKNTYAKKFWRNYFRGHCDNSA